MTKKEYILDFLKEINYAYNHPSMYDDLKRLLDEMEEEILESANCRWIPVRDRLPEEKISGCLVTVMDTDIVTQDEFENVYPDIVGYDSEYGTWNDCNGISIPFEVIAWMPLPEAYQED